MKSLKNRLILSYFGLTCVTLMLLGGLFFFMIERYSEQAEETLSQQVRQRSINQLYNFMKESPDLGELSIFIDSIQRGQGVEISLLDEHGEDLFEQYTLSAIFTIDTDTRLPEIMNMDQDTSGNSRNKTLRPNGMQWQYFLGNRGLSENNGEEFEILLEDGYLEFTIAGSLHTGELSVKAPEEGGISLFYPVGFVFLIAAGIVLLISGILGWKIGDSLTRPLRSLTKVVNDMSAGDLGVRATASSKDQELNQLAIQINKMAQELQGTITNLEEEKERLQRFLMDASHELRTPVTALAAYLELLTGKAKEDPKRREEYIHMCISQNNRSRDIIVNLLDLLRIEQYDENSRKTFLDISLNDLIPEVLDMVRPLAEEKQITIDWMSDINDSEQIFGNEFQLTTAVKNLVENSIKYIPKNTCIKITTTRGADSIALTILDEGEGIPEDEIDRIYDRFFRSKRATGTGSGLGLSIVKRIVENHRGSIDITNRIDHSGLKVVVSLPL